MNKQLRAYYGDDLDCLYVFLWRKTASSDIAKTILEYSIEVKLFFHDNGHLRIEMPIKDGKRHGFSKWWYESDKLSSEATYKNGKLHGSYKFWHGNGQLGEETTYKDGKVHGSFKQWHTYGRLRMEAMFKDGDCRDFIREMF